MNIAKKFFFLTDVQIINTMYKKNTDSSTLTGTTTETIMGSLLIPGSALQITDILRIRGIATKAGTAGSITMRGYFNTSESLVGATALFVATGGTTILWHPAGREVVFKDSLAAQEVFPVGAAVNFDTANQATAISSLTQNFAINQYLIITLQLGNGGDAAILRNFYVEVLR
jgi:hypothetical protein